MRNANRHIGAAFKSLLDAKAPQDGPKISIIIPAYNDEETIARTVGSCFNQTYGNIEIICVDDASPDATLCELERLAASDPQRRVKTIALEENGGPHNARLAGVMQASGELVCFLDSDDELARGACARIAAEHMREPVDILHFDTRVCRDGRASLEQALDVDAWTTPVAGKLSGRAIVERSFRQLDYSFSIWGKAYRAGLARRAFEELGRRVSDFGEDALEYFAIACFAESYRGLPGERLYVYHLGDGLSALRDMTADQFDRTVRGIRSVEGMREFIEAHDELEDMRAVYEAHRAGQARAMMRSWCEDVREQDRREALRRILEHWPLADVVEGACAYGTRATELLREYLGDELTFTSDQLYRIGVADGAAKAHAEFEASGSYRLGRALTAVARRLRNDIKK